MRRLADHAGRYKMLAVDQRPPIKNLVAERRGVAVAPDPDVAAVKRLLVEQLAPFASAALLDPHHAYPAAIDRLSPSQGLIITLEDSLFDESSGGRCTRAIDNWSVEKIKRVGGDAVKVLAWYRPDASPSVCQHQQDFVKQVGDACAKFDLPFVFELLVYPLAGEQGQTQDYVEQPGKRVEHVLQSVELFAHPDFGVDLFKLESPLTAADLPHPTDADQSAIRYAQEQFNTLGRLANRPWVMLSAGATATAFERVLHYAYRAGASGYLAGRAIWWQAFQHFPSLDQMATELATDGCAVMRRLNTLTDAQATAWHCHPCYGPEGAHLQPADGSFRMSYPEFSQ